MSKTGIERGSANVFADVDLPDAEIHRAKAELVHAISREIAALELSQTAAASRMGISQPDLSKMLAGKFRPISLEKLMDCLQSLGRDIEIAVKCPKRSKQRGTVRIRAA